MGGTEEGEGGSRGKVIGEKKMESCPKIISGV